MRSAGADALSRSPSQHVRCQPSLHIAPDGAVPPERRGISMVASRVAVMRDGRIEQLVDPREIYARPVSRYVANFVGLANEVPGTVTHVGGDRAVIEGPHGRAVGVPAEGLTAGGPAVAIWRPEDGLLSRDEPQGDNRWRAERRICMFAGPHCEHRLSAGDLTWRVWSPDDAEPEPVWVTVPPARTRILPA